MKYLSLLLLLCASCHSFPKKAEAPALMATSNQVVADPFISDEALLATTKEETKATIAPPKPVKKILDDSIQEEKTAPFGTLSAELVPHPGRELSLPSGAKVTLVSLRDLSKAKSEQVMIERRTELTARESLGGLRVLGSCLKSACTDGLVEQKSQRVILQDKPSQEELLLAKNGWLERLLRIATVGEAHTSVYLGRVAMQDNKLKQAILECATYHRVTGERLSVDKLIPRDRFNSMLRQAKELLQEKYPAYRLDPRSFLLMGPLPGGIKLCALAPNGSNEANIIELSL